MRSGFLFFFACACVLLGRAESLRPGEAWADSTLAALKRDLHRDPATTVTATDELLPIFKAERDSCSLAETFALRSTSFTSLGKLDSAMACAHRALECFRPGCDSLVLMRGQVAMSYLYFTLREYHRADSVCDRGLAHWNPRWRPGVLRRAFLTNKAKAAVRLGDLDKAEAAFRTILHLATEEGVEQDVDDALANLGAVKSNKGQPDSAAYYVRLGLNRALVKENEARIVQGYGNLATLYKRQKEYRRALPMLDSALVHADASGDYRLRAKVHNSIALTHAALGDYRKAYAEAELRYALHDSLLNEEKVRSMAEMEAKYQSAKQEKEISSLRSANLEAKLEQAEVKRTRNLFRFVALAVLGVAIALVSRLRYIGRSRQAMQREKAVSEDLLHNILPEEVADEIRAKGYADVHEFEQATILFTDFKDFTTISEEMSAQELVGEIDHCFKAFDGIVEKYGIEKIKTIGDAYMAAGGLPDAQRGSPLQMVRAALEMQDFMAAYRQQRTGEGRPYFVMRTGLHTGPVVAGIVGVKKYAYDIWGDTVNVANRMETSGEVGKVNISQTTYDLVKDVPGLRFTPRGAIPAKGKGMLQMYFVERA